jgi:hypothetical protein
MPSNMRFLSAALLLSRGTSGDSLPTARSTDCSFHLGSVGVINGTILEDHTGHLVLGGVFQQGAFSIDTSNNTVKDSLGHNCFMRGPDYEFQCYQGAVGTTSFDLAEMDDGKTTKVVYDNGDGTFLACPSGQNHYVYSTLKGNKTDCLEVALVLANQTSDCSASGSSTSTELPSTITTDLPSPTTADLPDTATAETPTSTTLQAASDTSSPSATCSVASSAPSVAPQKLGFLEDGAPDGIHDTAANASITSVNSTVFQYSIPRTFVNNTKQLCALEFRMPFCTDLPSGYPCFSFSGSEQEQLSNSGMVWSLLNNTRSMEWDSAALKQVFPGDKVVFGTFECGTETARDGARVISWLVSSVKNFGLIFQQAGVGESPKYQDGVGAWIVPCS